MYTFVVYDTWLLFFMHSGYMNFEYDGHENIKHIICFIYGYILVFSLCGNLKFILWTTRFIELKFL